MRDVSRSARRNLIPGAREIFFSLSLSLSGKTNQTTNKPSLSQPSHFAWKSPLASVWKFLRVKLRPKLLHFRLLQATLNRLPEFFHTETASLRSREERERVSPSQGIRDEPSLSLSLSVDYLLSYAKSHRLNANSRVHLPT